MDYKKIKDYGIIKLVLLYRYFSLLITSFIYVFLEPKGSLQLKLLIVIGLVLACVVVTYLYINNRSNKKNIIIILIIEVLGNGIILAVSGGFASPYIWYFISTLLIASLELYTRDVIVFSCTYFLIALITTFSTFSNHCTKEEVTLYVNIAMSYIMVVAGFMKLIHYAIKVEEKTSRLSVLNTELNEAKKSLEKTFQFSMKIYETVNLFNSNDNKNVMDGLLQHFCKLIKAKECVLILLSPFEKAGQYSAFHISDEYVKHFVELLQQSQYWNRDKDTDVLCEDGKEYKVQFIRYANIVYGAYVYVSDMDYTFDKEFTLFIKLNGIILTKMNYDEIGENLIISEEQNRIANEIHDIVLQKLFSISCNLYVLSTKSNTLDETNHHMFNGELLSIKKSVDITMRELREAIYGMSWEKEGIDSFYEKIKKYTEEIAKMNQISINLEIVGDTQWVTANQKTALFRLICESINNAIRHGEASDVQVVLSITKNNTNLTIIDNGMGFDMEKYLQKQVKGIGIRNIYRIVTLLRGTVEFISTREDGTTIIIKIPNSEWDV